MLHAIGASIFQSTLISALIARLPLASPPPPGLADLAGARRCWWTDSRLVGTLILVAWGKGSDGLLERFAQARAVWEPQATALYATTYQGFIRAWRRTGLALAYAAAAELRRRLAGLDGTIQGWCVLAVDGSRFELPRTAEHQRVFGVSGQAGSGPQLWVTVLWHLGLGLPWAWKVGRCRASERNHLLQMLRLCPPKSLLVADAGFVGYDLLQAIVGSGRHFLLRVGRNVSLLTQLGLQVEADGTVYLWPAYVRQRGQAPLVLRLICLPRIGGKSGKKMYLLTSVCDRNALNDALARELYLRRWGIELMYRSLKQTLEARKLRAHAPVPALLEVQGLLLGLTLLGLWQREAIQQAGGDPGQASVAAALKVLRAGLRRPDAACDWMKQLGQAVRDRYVRRAKTRVEWPRKKSADPPPGRPQLRRASKAEVQAAAELAA
jgi:hypothetical protein